MAGGIILSRRLERMQQAARDFGDTFADLGEQTRRRKLEDEDRAAAAEDRTLRNQVTQQNLDLGQFQARQAERQEKDRLALDQDMAAYQGLDSGLPAFGPQLPQDEPRMMMTDPSAGLRNRLLASIETKITGKPVTVADLEARRAEAEEGKKRKKEIEDRDYGLDERRVKVSEREAAAREKEAETKAATPKPPTESQSNAALFGRRMEQAMADMDALATGGHNAASKTAGIARAAAKIPGIGNMVATEDTQQQMNAETNFLTAVLRKESGASISPTEFSSGEKLYFPRAGDSEKTLEQKARNRQQALEGLRAAAGPAWETVAPVTRPGKAMKVGRFQVEEG